MTAPTSLPPLPSHLNLPLVKLTGHSECVEHLSAETLNVITPAMQRGAFYTDWHAVPSEQCFFRLVYVGGQLEARVFAQGLGLGAEIEQALRELCGEDWAAWQAALREHAPVACVQAALGSETASALQGSEAKGEAPPLRPEMGPQEEGIIIELHLLRAKRAAQNRLAAARRRLRDAIRQRLAQVQATVLN